MTYRKHLGFFYAEIFISEIVVAFAIINKGILPLHRDSVAIQIFIDVENKNSFASCKVYSKVKKCCLIDADRDCDMIDVYGEYELIIEAKGRKTFIYVFPLLYQHDLMGYCDILLRYHCKRKFTVLHENVPFDTRITGAYQIFKNYTSDVGVKCQTLDQDSLNRCRPADCDLKYGGERPFFDKVLRKCMEIPVCAEEESKNLANIVYDPQLNVCKKLGLQLSAEDIYVLSTGLGTISIKADKTKTLKMQLKCNCSTISQNLLFLRDLMYGKFCPCEETVEFKENCAHAIIRIVFSILSICTLLLFFLCCICTTIWFHGHWLEGDVDKYLRKVRNKIKRKENLSSTYKEKLSPGHHLLRGVVVQDIPIDLRESIENVCNRLQMEIHHQKRYRSSDIGSQISLQKDSH